MASPDSFLPSVATDNGIERNQWLDALRGTAISLVVIWHLMPPILNHYWPLGGRLVSSAWSGVDLFFVLSGFLIGGLLLRHRGSHSYFGTFYARRVLRIVPLYLVALLIFFNSGPEPFQPFYVLMIQNIVWAAQDKFCPSAFGMTWSLAVEEQFYLALPLLIAFCPARRLPLVLISCIVAAPLIRSLLHWQGYPHAAYLLLPARMDALSLGVLIAWAQTTGRLATTPRWLIPATIASFVAMLIFTLARADLLGIIAGTIGYSIVDLFYACLLALIVAERPRFPPWLAPLRLLGLGAFSIYLFHTMLLDIGQHWFGPHPLKIITFIPAMGLVAWACWRWIEAPCIRYAHRHFRYAPQVTARCPQGEGVGPAPTA